MKYQLIDVKNKIEQEVMFGTCDLCQHVGTHYYDVLIFMDEEGEVYEVENGFWSWREYFILWDIDNYVKFAHYISGKDFDRPTPEKSFEEIVSDMYTHYRDTVED